MHKETNNKLKCVIQFLREKLREGQGPRTIPGNGADGMEDCKGLAEWLIQSCTG